MMSAITATQRCAILTALAVVMLTGCAWWPRGVAVDRVAGLLVVEHVYHEGAASGGTILMVPDALDVARGFDVEMLIEHLDDGRVGRPIYMPGDAAPIAVPLGYLCLDVLIAGLDDASRQRVLVETGGAGLQVRDTFYFRPDVLRTGDYAAMARVKEAWRELAAESNLGWSADSVFRR